MKRLVYNIVKLLNEGGQPMKGSNMNDAQAMEFCLSRQGLNESFCLLRDWIWFDLLVSERQRVDFSRQGKTPAVIFSPTVIFDSKGSWDFNNTIRTSLLYEFESGFLFRTSDATYVLLGKGTRAPARPELLDITFF